MNNTRLVDAISYRKELEEEIRFHRECGNTEIVQGLEIAVGDLGGMPTVDIYSNKYIIEKIEEFGRHNALYDDVEGNTCYLAYLKVGERGWFLHHARDYEWPHRIHTSIIKDAKNTRGNEIIVTTENTRFTFKVLEE